MSSGIAPILSSLQSQHPTISLYTPEASEYEDLRKTYVVTAARPSAIVRPQTAEQVQAIVRLCTESGVDFGIRTGGHNCVGHVLVDNALLIDMRDISYVEVSEDKTTAKIGGGTLVGSILAELGKHGLITPCGSCPSVGYVGWSTLGGYGPFSALYGPGVDQIVSAKLVDARGNTIVVSEGSELLKGLRGGGGIFGAVVEVTAKVYPLKEMLVATLIYDSSDMKSIWTSVTEGIQSLSLPAELNVQIFSMDFPGVGKVLAAIVTWAGDDHVEGRKWIDQIAGFGTCIMNATEAKTASKYGEDNAKIVPYGVHGRSYALNLKRWTPKSVAVLAKYSQIVPQGGAMISIHSLRSPKANEWSVFGAREDHHMVEIVSTTMDPSLKDAALAWGQALLRELRDEDPENILDSAYISLLDDEDADVDLKKIYGKHYETLVALKKKFDPTNVFKHASPKIVL